MFAIAGLGNPGKKYTGTRHNAGFEVIRLLAARAGVGFDWDGRADGAGWQSKDGCQFIKTSLDGTPVVFLLPQLYMNRSGEAVQQFVRFYQIEPQDVVIVCDDMNLPLGRIRWRAGGSPASLPWRGC